MLLRAWTPTAFLAVVPVHLTLKTNLAAMKAVNAAVWLVVAASCPAERLVLEPPGNGLTATCQAMSAPAPVSRAHSNQQSRSDDLIPPGIHTAAEHWPSSLSPATRRPSAHTAKSKYPYIVPNSKHAFPKWKPICLCTIAHSALHYLRNYHNSGLIGTQLFVLHYSLSQQLAERLVELIITSANFRGSQLIASPRDIGYLAASFTHTAGSLQRSTPCSRARPPRTERTCPRLSRLSRHVSRVSTASLETKHEFPYASGSKHDFETLSFVF